MPAYRYHFMTYSKPATHLQAFAHLDPGANRRKPARALESC